MRKYNSEYSGENTTVTRFVLDSLHRIIYDGSRSYEYDSLNRIIKCGGGDGYDSIVYSDPLGLIEDYFFSWNVNLGLLKFTERFQGVNQKDSLANIYYYSGGGGILTDEFRITYLYTSFDSLSLVLTEEYNIQTGFYSTIDSLVYEWTPDNLVKTGYVYSWDSGLFQITQTESVVYNSLGEIQSAYSSASSGIPGYNISYTNSCGVPYESSYVTVGGSGQDFYSSNTYWIFDSLCRPVSNSGSYYNNSLGSSVNFHSEYYYADCNNILVIPNSVAICPGINSFPNLEVFGGTGMLTYQWSPADSVSDPTIVNPQLLGVTPQIYTLSISDQVGNTYIDSIDVYVNSLSVIIYGATCATCDNGGIVVNPVNPDNEITISPNVIPQQFPGVFVNIRPRAYWVCIEAQNCMTCDSIVVPDLSVSVPENEKSVVGVFPSPFKDEINFHVQNSALNSYWKLCNVNGQVVKSGIVNNVETRVDAEELISGIYFLKIFTENIQIFKLIKLE